MNISNKSLNDDKYIGSWPTNFNLDQITGPPINFECTNEVKDIGCNCSNDSDCINQNCASYPKAKYCMPKNGDIFPEFIGIDQYYQKVNIYDFSYQNKYIIIELATSWCNACKTLANWLSNDNNDIENKRWWRNDYMKIKELIKNNEIYYITILYENNSRENADFITINNWFQNYPDERIPILADEDKLLHKWCKPTGIPTTILLNEKMEIVNFSSRGINSSFDKILNLLEK